MTIFLIKDYGNTLFPDVIPIRTPKYQKLDQKHIYFDEISYMYALILTLIIII